MFVSQTLPTRLIRASQVKKEKKKSMTFFFVFRVSKL